MSGSFKKRRHDPGNSYFRGVYLRNYVLCLVITLTSLDEVRKIKGIQKQKEKRLTHSLPFS